ncbi:MAG: hypothetical protein P4L50_22950 [Anaerolineaceae bacterium]|nr:hypothetical protein [Anaerolineaceae bacterium]
MQISTKINNFANRSWFYALILLVGMTSPYIWQIGHLGFYWDDWQVVFLSHIHSAQAYWQYFLSDRPISAWTYILTVPILGMQSTRWQIFNLLVRWAGVLSFCWALRGVWPARIWPIRWTGLLLAVYPGFTQQTISVAYSQHFITFALYAISLGLMVWAVRDPKRFWLFTSLALFTALAQMMTMEYYVGLELLRPVFLWFLIHQKGEKVQSSALKVLKLWAPYLVVLGLFAYWRLVLFAKLSTSPDPNYPGILHQLATNPLTTVVTFIQKALQDSVYISLFAWVNTILPSTIDLTLKATLFSWALGLVVALLVVVYFWKTEKEIPAAANSDSFAIQSILAGVLGVILGGLPVWATGHQVIVGNFSDRFTLGSMAAAALLLVGLIDWLSANKKQRSAVLGIILGLSLASQIRTANKYTLNWNLQRQYYWQLFWRAPALKPGTAILGPKMPFDLVGDYSVGFGLDSLYAPNNTSTNVPVWFMYMGGRTDLADGAVSPLTYTLRDVTFKGDTSQSIGVANKPARGCLRVLDPIYTGAPDLTGDEANLLPQTHTRQIIVPTGADPQPQKNIFGQEPAHDWCYYFEKADLARQLSDWTQVVTLDNQAAAKGLKPYNGVELTPFIEAYAQLGQWDKASQITMQADQLSAKMGNFLCTTWQRIDHNTPGSTAKEKTLGSLVSSLHCNQAGVNP